MAARILPNDLRRLFIYMGNAKVIYCVTTHWASSILIQRYIRQCQEKLRDITKQEPCDKIRTYITLPGYQVLVTAIYTVIRDRSPLLPTTVIWEVFVNGKLNGPRRVWYCDVLETEGIMEDGKYHGKVTRYATAGNDLASKNIKRMENTYDKGILYGIQRYEYTDGSWAEYTNINGRITELSQGFTRN